MIRVMAAAAPGALDEAVRRLDAGGVVVIPTDTVYGVAARIDRPEAVRRIFSIKRRSLDKPLPVLVPDLERAQRLAVMTPEASEMAERGWPGPLTLVLPAVPGGGIALGGDGSTIGVRIPAHPVALELLRRAGSLAATSANRSGDPTGSGIEAAVEQLGEGVDLYLDAGPLGTVPSRVVSLVSDPHVLRD